MHRIASLAAEHGIPCSVGSNLEWDVATAAMLHLIVATPNLQVERYAGDSLGPSYHEFSIARTPLRIEGPFTTLNDGPGLGVEVDWELVERHRLESRLERLAHGWRCRPERKRDRHLEDSRQAHPFSGLRIPPGPTLRTEGYGIP